MPTADLLSRFEGWADKALNRPIPKEVVAFSFNVYEMTSGIDVDLIGCDSYSEEDPTWAQRELFTARDPVFQIPTDLAGSTWQESLDLVLAMVKGYLARDRRGSSILRSSRAVAVGFVDGDLQRVWPPVV